MQLELLLVDDMRETMPETTKMLYNFGNISVRFENETLTGLQCVVEDDVKNIIKWLKPYDGVAVGCGTPQLQQFSIMHIKDDL